MKLRPGFLVAAAVTAACVAPSSDGPSVSEAELTIQLLATAIETADTGAMLDLFWPEATYDDFANQQTHEGVQEIVAYLSGIHGWGDDVYLNMGRVHTTLTGAVGEWTFSAVQTRPLDDLMSVGTGMEIVTNGVTIIEMQGDRIIRAADYTDTAPLMLQLGGRIEMPDGTVITLEGDGGN